MLRVVGNGRVAGDPEIMRYEDTGRQIATFSIASRKRYVKEDGPTADFFRCVVFGDGVDFVEEYIKKGMMIIIDGRLDVSYYTNTNGDEVKRQQIIVDDIEFGESKKSYEERMDKDEEEEKEVKKKSTKTKSTKKKEEKKEDQFDIDEFDEDLPF